MESYWTAKIQTIQEKQWRPRRARQGGSKLPLLRSHAVVSTSGSSSAGALPPEVVSLLQSLASRDPNTAARLDGALLDPDKEKFAFETTPNQQCPEMPTNGVDAADFHQDTNCIQFTIHCNRQRQILTQQASWKKNVFIYIYIYMCVYNVYTYV